MCLYPKIITNKKYTPNKKNGGQVTKAPLDRRCYAVPIKCNKCMECMKAKAKQWQVRLLEDVRKNKNGQFITLTFSNESIKQIINGEDIKGKQITEPITKTGYELDNEIAKIAIKRFRERWRKEHKHSPRHWLVTELGHEGTENIHIHGIIWTDKPKEIEKQWEYGYIWKGDYVNEKTVNYIIKYVSKQDKDHKEYKPKVFTSAGIGENYIHREDAKKNKYTPEKTKETYTTRTGHQMGLPIYWKNKLYTEEEREKLWIEKLNKNERWVGGRKIDISKGELPYYQALKNERAKASRLGYQNDKTNWKQKEYEEQRRKYNMDKRTESKN